MADTSAKIYKLPLKDPILNQDNPRTISKAKFAQLVESVKNFPQMLEVRPIVISEALVVLGGNMRVRACIEAGLTEVPVIMAKDLTEDQKREFIIKDNVGFGEWNWEQIANEWPEAPEWGLDIPGMYLKQDAEEDDYEIPDEIETDIVIGDLFEIGEHRLLCGDSTKAGDVEKVMNGDESEMLFTSPPYADMRTYNGSKDLSISNLIEFIKAFEPYVNYQIINLGLQRKSGEVVQYWDNYIQKAKDCGYKFLSWNIWDRETPKTVAHITAMFAIEHEWIFVFGKDRKKLQLTVANKDAGKVNNHTKRRQKTGETVKAESFVIRAARQLGTIIRIQPQLARNDKSVNKHPACFPVALPAEFIKSVTAESEIISDPFLGSGTTMVAAHQLNRKCYGIEIDPKYCQVIIDRMRKLDPSLEIKKNGVVL